MTNSLVRARIPQGALRELDSFRRGARLAVVEKMPDDSTAAIVDALPASWIALKHDLAIRSSIVNVLGRDDAVEYFRSRVPQLVGGPLFRSMFASAVRMFGLHPGRLLRAAPVALRIAYQGFTDPRVVASAPDRAILLLENIAPGALVTDDYAVSFQGTFTGLFDLCSCEGTVAYTIGRPLNRISFRLQWSPMSRRSAAEWVDPVGDGFD